MDIRTVHQGAEAEVIEKKSRFIGAAYPVTAEDEAIEILERVKKQYWDARHHCWAYIIGETHPTERFSDDGEPGGTAGKPILEVLRGEKLTNTMVIVTRYFGGTLLGTGGLVRAYTKAAQETLACSTILTRIQGYRLRISTDYTGIGKIQYLLGQRRISIQDSAYTDKVELSVLVSEAEEPLLCAEITEGTNGQAVITREAACRFAETDGKYLVWETTEP